MVKQSRSSPYWWSCLCGFQDLNIAGMYTAKSNGVDQGAFSFAANGFKTEKLCRARSLGNKTHSL